MELEDVALLLFGATSTETVKVVYLWIVEAEAALKRSLAGVRERKLLLLSEAAGEAEEGSDYVQLDEITAAVDLTMTGEVDLDLARSELLGWAKKLEEH